MTNSVEALLQDKGLSFTYSGNDLLIKCLNPEHEDKSPSLRIDKHTGIGHCFSCGFKLSIFKYFDVINNFQDIKVFKIKEKIQKIYSDSVGLDFPSGFSLYNKEYRDISTQTLNHYEAFTHKDFENRIVFPLRDLTGKIRVFIGRHLYSDVGKRYDVKPSGIPLPFFPYDFKVINGTVILVEGIFDALKLIDNGIPNVVAIMGLQTINAKNYKEKIAPFKLMGANKIIVLFDGDIPGRKQTEILLPLLQSENLIADSIDLPDDMDPGSMSTEEIEQLKKMLK